VAAALSADKASATVAGGGADKARCKVSRLPLTTPRYNI